RRSGPRRSRKACAPKAPAATARNAERAPRTMKVFSKVARVKKDRVDSRQSKDSLVYRVVTVMFAAIAGRVEQARSDGRWPALAGAALTIAFALRIFRLGSQSFWADEGYGLYLASERLADLSRDILIDVNHVPGY